MGHSEVNSGVNSGVNVGVISGVNVGVISGFLRVSFVSFLEFQPLSRSEMSVM